VADVRESPALPIIKMLEERQAVVSYSDPFVPHLEHEGLVLDSQKITKDLLSGQDCVVITADHSCLDYQFIADNSNLLFDTRNATRGISNLNSHVFIL